MGKGLKKQETSLNFEKTQWAKKARVHWVEAKKAAENNDGVSCLELLNKAKNVKKFGYE
jgi:hypothetical protein